MDSELIAWRVEAERFADVRLMAELQQLARVDRKCEARILVLLAELDERELFLAQGYSSLFRYAVSALRMSEAQAYLRISAARVARSYPVVLEMLLEGALNLSTVKLLAPHLTVENHATLLERARNKTKREVELLVAEIAPKPDVQTRMRKMPERRARRVSTQAELTTSAARDAQATSLTTNIAPAIPPATIATPVATAELDPRTAAVANAATAPHVTATIAHAPITAPLATPELDPRIAGSDPRAAVANAATALHATATIAHAPLTTPIATAGLDARIARLDPRTAAVANEATVPHATSTIAHAPIAAPLATAELDPRIAGSDPHTRAVANAATAPNATATIAQAPIAASVAIGELDPRTRAVAHAAVAPQAAIAPTTISAPVAIAELALRAEAAHADLDARVPAASSPSAAGAAPRARAASALESPRASCSVLSPGRYRLELTVDQALFDQMTTLKHLLKHRVPSGDLGVVLGIAIKSFSERLCKQRFAELSKPASGARARASRNEAPEEPSASALQNASVGLSDRTSRIEEPSAAARSSQCGSVGEHEADAIKRRIRYIPREVVRAVFARDGAQCTFLSTDGKRCAERGMLELHHVKAFAHGGAPTIENLKVVCRSHNSYFATQDFGAAHMRTMRARAG